MEVGLRSLLAFLIVTPAFALSGGMRAPGDGTIVTPGGLIWQRCSVGLSGEACDAGEADALQWNQAKRACEDLKLAGKRWRLPTQDELAKLTASGQPTIDREAFPQTAIDDYWTSTSTGDSSHGVVNFYESERYSRYDSLFCYVRCVSGR
jgi:hypothetical protein